MSDAINIRRRRTVSFRTDCFATGYDTDYFVRSDNGYYPLITDISDGQNNYDVGYDPTAGQAYTDPQNPFVCDGLILDWRGGVEIGNVPYRHIGYAPYRYVEFQRPILAIPNSALGSGADEDHIILANDEYCMIDSLSYDPQAMTSNITGTKHENGQDIPYTGAFENLVRLEAPIDTYRMAFAPNRPYGEIVTYRFSNIFEIKALFSGTSTDKTIWNVIKTMTRGALVLSGYNDTRDHHISLFRYLARGRHADVTELYADPQTDGYLYYIIPFVSDYEFHAAKCAWSRWRNADILTITDWLNNR